MTRHVVDRVEKFVRDYLVLPDEHAYCAVVLWIGHTHATSVIDTTPRLAIYSPEYGCGKSRLLEVLDLLCHKPVHLANVSPAFVYRRVDADDHPPTLLLDEADTIWASGAGDTHQDLRGLINSGYRRGATVGRVSGPNRDKLEEFRTFAPVALAGRGRDSVPESVMTRSVVIPMRKRAPHEHVQRWIRRDIEPRAMDLREALSEWVADMILNNDLVIPVLPEEIADRDLEVWEPLVVVADAAGGHWPERARDAAVAAVRAGRPNEDEMPLPRRLLADVRSVFGEHDRIATAALLDLLNALPDAPWSGMRGGTGVTSYTVSNMLRDYGIRPGDIRFSDGVRKGYDRDAFIAAWGHYLPADDPVPSDSATSATSATTVRDQSVVIRSDRTVADVADVAHPHRTAMTDGIRHCQQVGCASAAGPSGWCWSHQQAG